MTQRIASGRKAAARPRRAAVRNTAAKRVGGKARAAKAPAANRRAATKKPAASPPYHHGDLRDALLKAAERILERDGLPGLTLRAVAREAGVSHAAPAHHFRDLAGLVSELAAIGYRRFGAAMQAAAVPGRSQAEIGLARGRAYVDFARTHPAMYQLMFRSERLDWSNPALREAGDTAFAELAGAIGTTRQEAIAENALTIDRAADLVRVWSLVHGFSMLLLDGRLSEIMSRLPAATTADDLLDAMLRSAGPPREPPDDA